MAGFKLEDVRRSYTPDKAWAELSGDLPARFLYRPLSFPLTLPLLALGVPAMAVTVLAGLLALTMFALALHGGPHAFLQVGALALCCHVLDCIDGNLARTRDEASLLGALADGAVDLLFWPLLLGSIGVLATRESHPLAPHALVLALGTALLVALSRCVRDVLAVQAGARTGLDHTPPAQLGLLDRIIIAISGLDQLYWVGLIVAGSVGALCSLLELILGYVSVMFVGSVVLALLKATRLDQARRASGGES